MVLLPHLNGTRGHFYNAPTDSHFTLGTLFGMLIKLWYYLIPHYTQDFYVDDKGYRCIRTTRLWLGTSKVIYDDSYAGGY